MIDEKLEQNIRESIEKWKEARTKRNTDRGYKVLEFPGMFPPLVILAQDEEKIEQTINNLQRLGYTAEEANKMIYRNNNIWEMNLDLQKMKKKIDEIKLLGYTDEEAKQIFYLNPELFTYDYDDDILSFTKEKIKYIEESCQYSVDEIMEMVKKYPSLLTYRRDELKKNIEILQKFTRCKELYRDSKYYSFLESIEKDDIKYVENIIKFLNNAEIMKNLEVKELEYLVKYSSEIFSSVIEPKYYNKALCNLIKQTYGERSAEILLERPRITINDIPNFYIFDSNIIDMIGYGGVHTFMNYNMKSSDIIEKIAKNPELIKFYKEYEKIFETLYPPSAQGLEERLIDFNKNIDLLTQATDPSELEKYKDDLLSYIYWSKKCGYIIRTYPEIKELMDIHTLQDLEGFDSKMNKSLDELVESGKVTKDLMLSLRWFKMNPELDEQDYIREYDQEGSEFLDDNQVNLVEVQSLINQIYELPKDMESKDSRALMYKYLNKAIEKIYDLIRENKPPFSTFQLECIYEKIIEEYKTKYIKSIFSVENIDEKSQETEKRIQQGTIDETSPNKNIRRVIKKSDGNLYFADHIESIDGKEKIYRYYKVKENENYKVRTRQYIYDDDKQFTRDDWSVYRLYTIGDYLIRYKWSELEEKYIFEAYAYDGKTIRNKDDVVEKLEKIIENGKICEQYNPEESYKVEPGDIEFYLVDKIDSNELMLTEIRTRPWCCSFYILTRKNWRR